MHVLLMIIAPYVATFTHMSIDEDAHGDCCQNIRTLQVLSMHLPVYLNPDIVYAYT